jgi:hypothetical protein
MGPVSHVSARDGFEVANGETGDQGLKGLFQANVLVGRVAGEAAPLDQLALPDHILDEVGVLVAEVGADRIQMRVHEPLDQWLILAARGLLAALGDGQPLPCELPTSGSEEIT